MESWLILCLAPVPAQPLNHAVVQAVSYEDYFQEILCFTTGSSPSAQNLIRDQLHALCSHQNNKVHTCTVKMPRSDIPQVPWSFAFAPSILRSGAWVIVFAAPMDSEMVWFFWPEKNESEDKLMEFLTQTRIEGKIKPEETMGVGSERHRQFHAMVQQAIWQGQNADLLGQGWGSGEFRLTV